MPVTKGSPPIVGLAIVGLVTNNETFAAGDRRVPVPSHDLDEGAGPFLLR